jgi:hypothetical protein
VVWKVVTKVSGEHATSYKISVDNQTGNKRRFSGEISTEYVKHVFQNYQAIIEEKTSFHGMDRTTKKLLTCNTKYFTVIAAGSGCIT